MHKNSKLPQFTSISKGAIFRVLHLIRNPGYIHLLQQKYAKSVRVLTIGWTMTKLALEQSIQCSRALIYAFVHIILWGSLVFYFCVTKALISIEIHTE